MAKEIEKDEVSVVMTKTQKEKVLKLLAEDEAKKAPIETVKVHLSFEHTRNERKYFGLVEVPADLAASLLVADQRFLQARLRENQSNDNLVEIVGRGHTRIIKNAPATV